MQISPDYTILIQFGQLVVLLIFFNFFLFKPVLKALEKRQGTMDSMAGKAQANGIEAREMGKAYEERLKEQKVPVLGEREGLLKETHANSMKVVEEARQDLARELADVKDAVRREAQKSLESLKADSDRLATEVVAKIMSRGR